MKQENIHNYLRSYFLANECPILQEKQGVLAVQLTVDLDKELMNRPFYWHYLEKTGGTPNPMTLTLVTNQDEEMVQGEFVHFGAPRLHQIFSSTKKLASFIRLYENIQPSSHQNAPLHPWLCLNIKISYQCDLKKDRFISLGLHLVSGAVVDDFHDQLSEKNLTPKIPDYTFTISPIIKPASGISRLEKIVEMLISKEDHSWSEEAKRRWAADQLLLDQFYEDNLEAESYAVEKEALRKQYEPVITAEVINGGIFYLSP
ncbi:YqhG family protein [Guptibacillus algicola]|uniref:YqhG family protein n=1 Tax=Guptibacillus algicola TaxID=225844 RepID=UPI001CD4F35B|nr:YqhG family protein [Alkalihalobacillus algicola]MCA0986001.1 YqhG family protein [Alkalihalobacillus algicola]